MKFKKGMKVKILSDQEGYAIKGLMGEIVADYGNSFHFGIKFKAGEFDEGHTLDGSLPRESRNGLWVEIKKLRPVNMQLENK